LANQKTKKREREKRKECTSGWYQMGSDDARIWGSEVYGYDAAKR